MLAFLRHLFTPHRTNNHRPKVLHPQTLIFYILFFLFLQFNLANLKILLPNILGLATDINVESLLSMTNQKRLGEGFSSLTLDPQLSQAAAAKAQDMFTKDYWAHNAPDGTSPWVFIKGADYNYLYAGENLAKNFSNSEGVVNAWMVSPTHRANILKPDYKDVGFAVVNGRLNGEETTLVVQMFGVKQGSEIAAKPLPRQTISPQPTISLPKATPTPTSALGISPIAQEKVATLVARSNLTPMLLSSAKNSPAFNIFSLTRNSSLFLIGFLLLIISLDTYLIWRRKTIRIAGHNFAHFFFLLTAVLAIWLTRQGVIR